MPVLQRLATGGARGFGFGVGGITYSSVITEAASGADSISATQNSTYQTTITELASGADSISATQNSTYQTTITETASGADVTSSELGISYWMASYYGSSTSYPQYAHSVAVDSSDNIYVVGAGNTSGITDAIMLVKYSDNGALQWQRKLDGTVDCVAYAVTTDSSGDVYVAGGYDDDSTSSDQLLQKKGIIAKYDSSGTLVFQELFYPSSGSNLATRVYGITVDSSGNIYTTGYTNNVYYNMFVAKHNSSGVLQWFKRYGYGLATANTDSFGSSIKINSSGNLVIGGSLGYAVSSTIYSSPLIAIYDTSGNLLSATRFVDSSGNAGTRDSQFYSIALDSSDNIYATGVIGNGTGTSGSNGAILVKFDSSVSLLWATEVIPSTTAVSYPGRGVAVDSSGNPYIMLNNPTSFNSMVIAKFNTSGTLQWSNMVYPSVGDVVSTSSYRNTMQINSEDNLVITYYNTASSNTFASIAKLPSDGSRTGSYTVGPYGQPTVYTSVTLTQYTLSWTTTAGTGTASSSTTTTLSAGLTSYNPSESSSTTYI